MSPRRPLPAGIVSLASSADPSAAVRRVVAVLAAVAFVSVIVVLVSAGVAGATDATPVSSCRTITEPGVYELTGDVQADGTCIEIRSSDVTFDGNGYVITQASGLGPGAGVLADGDDRLTNVTVRNVTVTYFDVGVQFRGVDRSEIRDVNASCNREEGFNVSGDRNRVVSSVAYGNHGHGFEFPSASADGTNFDSPANNYLADDAAVHNGGNGFVFHSHTHDNVVRDSLAGHNAGRGFATYNGHDNVFRDDRAVNNFRSGFSVSGEGNRLLNATAVHNHALGFKLGRGGELRNGTAVENDGVGVALRESGVVAGTLVRDNAKAGIGVWDGDATVTNNTVVGNGGPGIERDGHGNRVWNNAVEHNRDDAEQWDGCEESTGDATVTRWCDATAVELTGGYGEVLADFRDVTAISVAVGENNTVAPSAIVVRQDFTQHPQTVSEVDRLRTFEEPSSGRLEFLVAVDGDHYGQVDLRVTFHTPDGPVVRHVTLPVQRYPYLPPTGSWANESVGVGG